MRACRKARKSEMAEQVQKGVMIPKRAASICRVNSFLAAGKARIISGWILMRGKETAKMIVS
jgi:hypothetical protein